MKRLLLFDSFVSPLSKGGREAVAVAQQRIEAAASGLELHRAYVSLASRGS